MIANSHRVVLIIYLEEGKTGVRIFCASLLNKTEIAEKRKKKKLFYQHNVSFHTSAVAMMKIYELLFDHIPYSRDRAPVKRPLPS